jgi:hypothetical protein
MVSRLGHCVLLRKSGDRLPRKHRRPASLLAASASVNCVGKDGIDIHLSLGPQGATEYQGIVGKIIPQLPKTTGWDSVTLNRLHTASTGPAARVASRPVEPWHPD